MAELSRYISVATIANTPVVTSKDASQGTVKLVALEMCLECGSLVLGTPAPMEQHNRWHESFTEEGE